MKYDQVLNGVFKDSFTLPTDENDGTEEKADGSSRKDEHRCTAPFLCFYHHGHRCCRNESNKTKAREIDQKFFLSAH